jgi:hypothetical protein
MPSDPSFYTRSKTATANTPFHIDDDTKIVLSSINIHCYTNDAYYGTSAFQSGIIRANAVVWFDKPVRVSDIWFKNYTAGSNTVITITGTLVG